MALNLDLSALKDKKTTLPGLGMILLTILILAGKLQMAELFKYVPLDTIISLILGGGGAVLLAANSNKPATTPEAARPEVDPAPLLPAAAAPEARAEGAPAIAAPGDPAT